MDILINFSWLILTVYLEARGESSAGRIMVAHTILNRAAEHNLTIEEVVLKPNQFECWNEYNKTGKMPTIKHNTILHSCIKDCMKALEERLEGKIGEGVTHYFNPKHACPKWAKKMEIISVIGNHAFLRE